MRSGECRKHRGSPGLPDRQRQPDRAVRVGRGGQRTRLQARVDDLQRQRVAQFGDLGLAFRVTFLNKCDELERATVAEFFQKAFGQDLPDAVTRRKIV